VHEVTAPARGHNPGRDSQSVTHVPSRPGGAAGASRGTSKSLRPDRIAICSLSRDVKVQDGSSGLAPGPTGCDGGV